MRSKEVAVKRIFLVFSIIFCAGLVWSPLAQAQVVQTPIDPNLIPKFKNELPLLGPTGLPVLIPGETPAFLSICEFQTQVLPHGTPLESGATGKTHVWGYQVGDTCDPDPGHSFIGPVVVAQRGTPTSLTFINQLGN